MSKRTCISTFFIYPWASLQICHDQVLESVGIMSAVSDTITWQADKNSYSKNIKWGEWLKVKTGYLGPKATFTDLAVREMFPDI